MRLNDLKPAVGSRSEPERAGRGYGSNRGSTAGRGDRGQKSRSGGYHKVGFEGGQMPLQRRLPKRGFRSMNRGRGAEVRLHELNGIDSDIVDLSALKTAGLLRNDIKTVKIILSGKLEKAVKIRGLRVTKGARVAIESAGGSIED